MYFDLKIVLYKNNFYTDIQNLNLIYVHNRLKSEDYLFKPLNISQVKLNEKPILLNNIFILLDHFHWNPAHNLWDHIYPSFYSLFYYLNDQFNKDFQFIVIKPPSHFYQDNKHIDLIEKISGSKLITIKQLSELYNYKPIIFSNLLTISYMGNGIINKNNFTVSRGLEINNIDPIETFINRIYCKYNIKRNSLINNLDICNNIIFIKNKRPMNGMEELFQELNIKYNGKFNFKIIDYSNYNFEEQLNLLNTTCICIVGVGTARFNTPFLPNGAIEIQTYQPNVNRKNFIEYLDPVAGTLSKYVKVKNIPYYTKDEATNKKISHLLENYIEQSMKEIPCKIPINLEDNLPKEILNLKNNKNYYNLFDEWRNGGPNRGLSNSVEDFFDMLNE